MPKKIDYPRASFESCLKLAEAVESLGGQCDMGTCAAKMNKKPSGAFNALIGASTKFRFITRKQGKLYTSDLYNKMKLSYTEEEKKEFLRILFLNADSFKEIYEKYKKVKLPLDILDKALVKEFNVEKKLSQRVAKYFVDGAKFTGLLNQDNTFNEINSSLENKEIVENNAPPLKQTIKNERSLSEEDYSGLDKFIVHIYGKGMNSKIEINEMEDLTILNAMINKIKKNLNLE